MADQSGLNNDEAGNGEYVTRRELTLTLRPLVNTQEKQTSILAEISQDLKNLLFQHEREVGAAAAETKLSDTRRFWMTMVASLASGIVVVAVIGIAHLIVT